MILGSHNTMSYLKPRHWWLYPFRFMAKCQDKNIQEQYKAGARIFDFRITFDKKDVPFFSHGSLGLKGDVYEPLEYLNNLNDNIYVRILNERDNKYDVFVKFCEEIESKYTNIKFIGGINKKTWKQLYHFGHELSFIDKYSSWNNDTSIGTGWYLDDLYPRIYAFCLNKHWREKYQDKDIYLLQDFVGVY